MKKTVCIYGCAKNVEQYLPSVFKNIDKLREIFDVKGVYVGCDESDDSPLQLLSQYDSKLEIYIYYPDNHLYKDKLIDSYGNLVSVNFVKSKIRKQSKTSVMLVTDVLKL